MANVRHRIPVSVAVAPSTPPVAIRGLARFPVENGGAIYQGPSRPQDQRWAFKIVELASGRAVFRSGPMQLLPGRPPGPGAVMVLHSGANFGLNLPDGGPEIVTEQLQSLPPPLQFVRVELGSDAQGQYVITLRGRLEVQDRVIPFTYIRPLRLVGSLDPGRRRPIVIAEPAGSVTILGANVRPFAAALNAAISNAVQEQLNASVTHLTGLEVRATRRRLRAHDHFGDRLHGVPALRDSRQRGRRHRNVLGRHGPRRAGAGSRSRGPRSGCRAG